MPKHLLSPPQELTLMAFRGGERCDVCKSCTCTREDILKGFARSTSAAWDSIAMLCNSYRNIVYLLEFITISTFVVREGTTVRFYFQITICFVSVLVLSRPKRPFTRNLLATSNRNNLYLEKQRLKVFFRGKIPVHFPSFFSVVLCPTGNIDLSRPHFIST